MSLDDRHRWTRHHNFIRLHSAAGRSGLAVLFECASHQVREVNTNLRKHAGMLMHNLEAFLPDRGAALYAAQLSAEQTVETIQVMLGPANTGAGHHAGEALLIDANGVFNQGEIDKRDLENVKRKVTLKYASPDQSG